MESAARVLKESFSLLLEQPRLFVPKLFSTVIASGLLVFLLQRIKSGVSIYVTAALIPALLFISVVGVYASMMLSEMVKSGSSLKESYRRVKERQRNVISTAVFFILVGFALSALPVIGFVAYLSYGSLISLFSSVLLFLAVLFAISYASYFLPITLIEKDGLRTAFSDSIQTSEENRSIVMLLLIFSLALFGLAGLSTGYLEKVGYAGFVAGRLVSSIVNTYVFTVSPAYYLESRPENFD